MRSADREHEYIVVGEFVEYIENKKLVFTWSWEHQPDRVVDTRVTLTFDATADGTALTLIHERFADARTRNDHNDGWIGCLNSLTKLLDP